MSLGQKAWGEQCVRANIAAGGAGSSLRFPSNLFLEVDKRKPAGVNSSRSIFETFQTGGLLQPGLLQPL